MAKRGSFSISAAAHARVKAHCDYLRISVSSFIEQRLGVYFDGLESPGPRVMPEPTTEQRLDDLDRRVTALEPADYRPAEEQEPF